MHPICPSCGHAIFRPVNQPGRAACALCGTVSTRAEAVLASLSRPAPPQPVKAPNS